MRKLKFLLAAVVVIGIFFTTGCKKTTTTVVQDSVYYSSWTALAMTYDSQDTLYFQDFTNKAITANVLSRGAVVGYLGYVSSSGDTVAESVSDFSSYGVGEAFSVGAIEITSYNYDLSYDKTSGAGYFYRYVIIPGNVLSNTSLSNLTQQQLNKMNFTDIQKALQGVGQSSSGNKVSLP
ncbi:MAG TPA: hypothetical protein VG605_16570 [Puia sp.]|nr:hypothetical protein [Puia sp.]